ncbi:MAG: accessory factor UbiK family protein [Acidiferrobacterales bacterium]
MTSKKQTIDGLMSAISDILPKNPRQELEKNLRATLSSTLDHMQLVTREEFDVQQAVLARTREKLEQLEKLVAELEQQLVKS